MSTKETGTPSDETIAARENESEVAAPEYDDYATAGQRRCFQKYNGNPSIQCKRASGHNGEHVFDVGGESVTSL